MNWLYNGFIETALNAYCHINQHMCGYRLVLYKITTILKKSTTKRIGTMNKCKVIGEHKNYHNTMCNELARSFVYFLCLLHWTHFTSFATHSTVKLNRKY